MSGIIGFSSLSGSFSVPISTSTAQTLMSGAGTYTAAAGDTATSVNFTVGSLGLELEVGIYDVSNGDLLISATATSPQGGGVASATINQALSSGVEYAVGWRCVTNPNSVAMEAVNGGAQHCVTNSLTGTSALANPFSSPYPPTTYDTHDYLVWATVTGAGSPPVDSGGKLLISNGHIVTSALLFMPLSWSINRRNKRAAERRIVVPGRDE